MATSDEATDEHPYLLFPTSLQTHTHPAAHSGRPPKSFPGASELGLDSQLGLELSLKVSALLGRGLVISDSDLNNNTVFHGLANRESTFRTAVEIGFIRRAARFGPSGPATQAEVGESLAKSNPRRFSEIPDDHISSLDAALASAESRSDTAPLLWTFDQLGTLFTYRLLKLLDDEAAVASRGSPVRTLLHRMSDWIRGRLADRLPVTAAGIEQAIKPSSPTDAEAADWDAAVWPLVLTAYTGNVPTALELTLSESSDEPMRFLPSGPTSPDDELTTELALYGLPAADALAVFDVERYETHLPELLSRIDFDYARLSEMDLRDVIELRERSAPEMFFGVRHTSLGSAAQLETQLPAFLAAGEAYVERLMNNGRVLTERATRDALLTEPTAAQPPKSALTTFVLRSSDPEFVADQVMMCLTQSPFVPARIAMCDAEKLRRLWPDIAQALDSDSLATPVHIARPDYRIIASFGESLSR